MRIIDADELLTHIEDYGEGQSRLDLIDPYYVRNASTVDAKPIVHAKWLNRNTSDYHFFGKCSKCEQEFCIDAWYIQEFSWVANMKYCPNCGAKMYGKGADRWPGE